MKNKIWLIVEREYMTRVRKKSFIIMTLLSPILFAGLVVVPIVLSQIDKNQEIIAVVDETSLFVSELKDNNEAKFEAVSNLDSAQARLRDGRCDLVLSVRPTNTQSKAEAVVYYFEKEPGLSLAGVIENQLQSTLQNKLMLETYQISTADYEKVKAIEMKIATKNLETGQETSTGLKTGIGYVSAFLIYMFVFLFGAQVMGGVVEEKSSRILEVIVSSVKPFQIMMGKIVGIAFVGLTQFLLWILLTAGLVSLASVFFASGLKPDPAMTAQAQAMTGMDTEAMASPDMMQTVFSSLDSINFPLIICMFLIFFIGGYLLYASLFAAVGSAVENDADTNQFMMPITIPLIVALITMASVMENPNGQIAFWMSMIPLTSPIIMLMRVPFGVPVWELCLSISLLIMGFIFTTWLAARIYRVGILMYGKKVSYAELWKWIRYK